MDNNSLKGIGLLQLSILHLISIGKTETITEIEKHFKAKDLVEYLYSKYESDFLAPFNNSIYSNDSINSYFAQYDICGNEDRKYGITKNEDGFLLILALLSNKIEEESINWSTVDQ